MFMYVAINFEPANTAFLLVAFLVTFVLVSHYLLSRHFLRPSFSESRVPRSCQKRTCGFLCAVHQADNGSGKKLLSFDGGYY